MKNNEKAVAETTAEPTDTKTNTNNLNFTTVVVILQQNSRTLPASAKLPRIQIPPKCTPPKILPIKPRGFCCDECALPLLLYGENFIETYKNGKANPLKCLCDIHAAERGWIQ